MKSDCLPPEIPAPVMTEVSPVALDIKVLFPAPDNPITSKWTDVKPSPPSPTGIRTEDSGNGLDMVVECEGR